MLNIHHTLIGSHSQQVNNVQAVNIQVCTHKKKHKTKKYAFNKNVKKIRVVLREEKSS